MLLELGFACVAAATTLIGAWEILSASQSSLSPHVLSSELPSVLEVFVYV